MTVFFLVHSIVKRTRHQPHQSCKINKCILTITCHIFIFLVIGCKSVGPCSDQTTGSQTRFRAASGELFALVSIKAAVKFAACLLASCFGAADNSCTCSATSLAHFPGEADSPLTKLRPEALFRHGNFGNQSKLEQLEDPRELSGYMFGVGGASFCAPRARRQARAGKV